MFRNFTQTLLNLLRIYNFFPDMLSRELKENLYAQWIYFLFILNQETIDHAETIYSTSWQPFSFFSKRQ